MLSFALAALDAAAGAYFIRYAVRGERRDKDGVMAVGFFLSSAPACPCCWSCGWSQASGSARRRLSGSYDGSRQ